MANKYLSKELNNKALEIELKQDGNNYICPICGGKNAQKLENIGADIPSDQQDRHKLFCPDCLFMGDAIDIYMRRNDLRRSDAIHEIILKYGSEAEKKDDYLAQSAGATLGDFFKDLENQTPPTPTGFKELDKALEGGLYEGLYILGAISSMGKTTYILQIADQVAAAGRDVLFYSLEMAKSELISKSLSRLTLQISKSAKAAKNDRAITSPEKIAAYTDADKKLLQDAGSAYKQIGAHLWLNEGVGDINTDKIRQGVERHIALTGNRPVVIIDYFQILPSIDPRLSDKQAADRNIFNIKRLSRDFKIPIIVISSLNRGSYDKAVNMSAYKESGGIEYTADVLLGLQASGAEDADAGASEQCRGKAIRDVEIKILKNRHGRITAKGEAIQYKYYAMFNLMQETDGGEFIPIYDASETPFKDL